MTDLMELTIPQLEYLLDGFKKNNEDMEKELNGKKKPKGEVMQDADAIQYLIKSGQVG